MQILEFGKRQMLRVWGKQGDTGRELEFQCVKNGIPIDLNSCTVTLNMTKPEALFTNAVITNATEGKIRVNLTSDMLSKRGMHKADISIFNSLGKVISSATFELDVDPSQRDEDGVEASDKFSALQESIGRINGFESQLAEKAAQQALEVEKQRINNLVAPPAGVDNAETADIRVSLGGTVYSSAGDAIRGQVGTLKKGLDSIDISQLSFASGGTIVKELFNNSTARAWFSVATQPGGVISADVIAKNENVPCATGNELTLKCLDVVPMKYSQMVSEIYFTFEFLGSNGVVLQRETIRKNNEGFYGGTVKVTSNYVATMVLKVNLVASPSYSMAAGENVNINIGKLLLYKDKYVIDVPIKSVEELKDTVERIDDTLVDNTETLNKLNTQLIEKVTGNNYIDNSNFIGKTLSEVFPTSAAAYVSDVVSASIDENKKYYMSLYFDDNTSSDNNIRINGYAEDGTRLLLQTLVSAIDGRVLKRCKKIYIDANQTVLSSSGNKVIKVFQLEQSQKSIVPQAYSSAFQDGYSIACEEKYNGEFRSYYTKDYLDNFINRAISRINSKSLTFGYITDIQGRDQDYMDMHYKNISNICKYIPAKFIADTGDFIEGAKNGMTKEDMANALTRYANLTNNTCPSIPYIITRGNHDDNGLLAANTNKYSDLIDDKEWYSRVAKYVERHKEVVYDTENPYGFYYYVDDNNSKIRTLFINTCDIPYVKNADGTYKYTAFYTWAIRQRQLEFIRNALMFSDKRNPTEWGVLVMWHFPNVYTVQNIDGVIQMLRSRKGTLGMNGNQNYTNGTGDFAVNIDWNFDNCQGEVIGVFTGHNHRDELITHNSSELMVIASDGSMFQSEYLMNGREFDTITEDSFNIVNVIRESKKIYMTRFGAGYDKILNYKCISRNLGSTETLVSELSGELTWSSNDDTIATVSNGVVSYIKANSTTIITATNADGIKESWIVRCLPN